MKTTNSIRAELIGSDTATACGYEVVADAPVLALCRRLIAAGCDARASLRAYRGDTLCLRVRSLIEGARLTVKQPDHGRVHFAQYKRLGPSPVASLVRKTTGAATPHRGAQHEVLPLMDGGPT